MNGKRIAAGAGGLTGVFRNDTGDTATLQTSSGTCSWTTANDPSRTC